MNDALSVFYQILSKALNTFFNIYLFNGVSLGMIFVTGFIFSVLLKYLLAIPKMRVGGHSREFTKSNDSQKTQKTNN